MTGRGVGRAARCFRESLTLRADTQDRPGITMGLEAPGGVAGARGRASGAVRLLAAADAWRRARGLSGPDADREACDCDKAGPEGGPSGEAGHD